MNMISRGLVAAITLGLPAAQPAFANTRAAAPQIGERVVYADLDLTSNTGAAELLRRVRKAAVSACDSQGRGPSLEDQDRFDACRRTAVARALADLDARTVAMARR